MEPPRQTNYIQYNNLREVEGLDKNVWDSSYAILPDGSTGRHLYDRQIPERYPCFRKQNPKTHFITSSGSGELPDYSSRFGYPGCPNGYCLGNFPGKRIQPPGCDDHILPPSMAPEQFYNEPHTNPYNMYSNVVVDRFWP